MLLEVIVLKLDFMHRLEQLFFCVLPPARETAIPVSWLKSNNNFMLTVITTVIVVG